MALSVIPKNFCNGKLTILDGAALTFEIPFHNGDLSLGGLSDTWRDITKYETRGVFNTAQHTTRTYPTISFSCKLVELTNVTTGNILDALNRNGAWAAATGTLGTGLPYCVNLKFEIEGTDFGDGADGTTTFTKCRCVYDITEGDPDTINVTAEVLGTATGDLAPTAP